MLHFKDGKESTYIKQKEKQSLEEYKHSEEKEKSNGAQKDVKDASALTVTKDLGQLDVSQQKQDETCHEDNKDLSKNDSQQGQHTKQGKSDQDKVHNQNTHANQPERKDDETIHQLPIRHHHLQNDHENNENSNPNVKDKDNSKIKKVSCI